MSKYEIVNFVFGPLDVNTYLIADPDSKECFCIDPGGEPSLILKELETKKWRLKGILLTHAHFDHIMGVRPLCDELEIPVYLHPLDLTIYNKGPEKAMQWLGIKMDQPPETKVIKEEVPIVLGEKAIIVLHTPGHSPGSCSFFAGGAIFVGDLIFNGSIGRTDFEGGDFEVLLNSIHNKILTLPDETKILPGHGPHTTVKEEKQNNPFIRK